MVDEQHMRRRLPENSRNGGGIAGLGARLHWELQGMLGGGEFEVACWPTPSPIFIRTAWQPKGLSRQIFAIVSEFGPIGRSAFQRKIF